MYKRKLFISFFIYVTISSLGYSEGLVTKKYVKDLYNQINNKKSKQSSLDDEIKSLQDTVLKLNKRLVLYATQVRSFENKINSVEKQISALDKKSKDIKSTLNSKDKHIEMLLSAIEKLAAYPPEAVIFSSRFSPRDMVRVTILMQLIIPKLGGETLELRSKLEDLLETKESLIKKNSYLNLLLKQLENKRSQVKGVYVELNNKSRNKLKEQKELQASLSKLKLKASNAEVLLKKLEEARIKRELEEKRQKELEKQRILKEKQEALKNKSKKVRKSRAEVSDGALKQEVYNYLKKHPFKSAKGRLLSPVVGATINRYGTIRKDGTRDPGFRIRASGYSQVMAPYAGRIAYADSFKGYGLLVILEHGDSYHTLLSGFKDINVRAGQYVLRGTPIGSMNKNKYLAIEVRRNGTPISPSGWFR